MKKRNPIGRIKMENMARVAAFNIEKQTKNLLNKYGINSDFYDNIMNTNHKDDWNCYNCGNVNYAFRLNCNRCQSKRENFPNNESQNENKTPAINLDN